MGAGGPIAGAVVVADTARVASSGAEIPLLGLAGEGGGVSLVEKKPWRL